MATIFSQPVAFDKTQSQDLPDELSTKFKIKRSLNQVWEKIASRSQTYWQRAKIAASVGVLIILALNIYNKTNPAHSHDPRLVFKEEVRTSDGKTLIVEQIKSEEQTVNACGWFATGYTMGRAKKLLADPKNSNPKEGEALIEEIYPTSEFEDQHSNLRSTFVECLKENTLGKSPDQAKTPGESAHKGACGKVAIERLLNNMPLPTMVILRDENDLDTEQQAALTEKINDLKYAPNTQALSQLAESDPVAYEANIKQRAFLELNFYDELPYIELTKDQQIALRNHVRREKYDIDPYKDAESIWKDLYMNTTELDPAGVKKVIELYKEKDDTLKNFNPVVLTVNQEAIEKHTDEAKQAGIHGFVLLHDPAPDIKKAGGASDEKSKSRLGHWTSLVINRQGNTVTYDIADSLGNRNHANKEYLFSMLSKYESPETLAAYRKELEKREKGAIAQAWYDITHLL